MKMILVLPNGKEYVLQMKTYSKISDVEAIEAIRKCFSKSESIHVAVDADDNKTEVLILWGDVLKNIYIKVIDCKI